MVFDDRKSITMDVSSDRRNTHLMFEVLCGSPRRVQTVVLSVALRRVVDSVHGVHGVADVAQEYERDYAPP